MEKIRIGVLGFATIAQKALIPAMEQLTDCFEFVGVATRTSEKATAIASKVNGRVFSNYSDMLTSNVVDAVYIPLPNALHFEWVKTALENGLHVLVEKSMACSLEEVVQLQHLAAQKKLALLENFQFRFHSQLAIIKNEIEKGTIGELRSIRSTFGFPPFPDSDNIRYQKQLGGGALLDAGAYPIKLAQLFMGNDIKVTAAMMVTPSDKEVAIWGAGTLQQNSGPLFLQMAYGFDSFYQCNLEILGSLGKLTTQRIYTAPPGLATELVIETKNGLTTMVLAPDNHYQKMLRYFYSCIHNTSLQEEEYQQNILQARLLDSFKKMSDEK